MVALGILGYNGGMKLIVGLGNPGSQYNFTRHNFGFLALDFYAKVKGLTWENEKRHALWLKDGERILIKPQTFYNESGRAVQEFMQFYKLTPAGLLVVCDDFWLDFGQMRYRAKGSDGGSNGLKSIIRYLGTTEFARLRLGTNDGDLRQKMGDVDFVLSKFTEAEKAKLPDLLREICARIEEIG